MKKKLYIIGAGTGNTEFLTEKGLMLIKSCNVVYSICRRLSQQFFNIRNDIIESSVSEIQQEIIDCKREEIGVLVSGDTGFFSITKILLNSLSSYREVNVICGISSLQYFCSKIGISYENLKTVSLHGRDNAILGAVSYNQNVFVLTGGANKANLICRSLVDNGMGFVTVIAGQNLSMSNENIMKGSPEELSNYSFDDLTVLLIENNNYVRHYTPLKDEDFIRGNVPMTKEEVRCVTLSKLAIEPCDVVYDIGAGTGSVAIEMARKAYEGCVYAIEQNEEGIALINKNRERLGGYNVTVIHGKAPEALEILPKPDKAFIGGSSGRIKDIVDLLIDKNPKIKLVVNAITLETLNEAVSVFEKHKLRTDVVCLNIANSKKVGGYHMMNANNPVYIITGG